MARAEPPPVTVFSSALLRSTRRIESAVSSRSIWFDWANASTALNLVRAGHSMDLETHTLFMRKRMVA